MHRKAFDVGKSMDEPGSLSFLVRHAWLSMRAAVERELRGYGLSVAQYATLMIVGEQAGCSVADIGRAVASTRQSANELITGLERDGLITRSANPEDRRTQRIVLTDHGRQTLEAARPAVARREAALEAAFTPEQRQTAHAWLTGVSEAAGKPAD